MADTIVAQSSALWVEKHQLAIEQALGKVIPCRQFIWRRAEARLKQDGYTGDMKDIVRGVKAGSSSSSVVSSSNSVAVDLSVPIEEVKATKRPSLLSRPKSKSSSEGDGVSESNSSGSSDSERDGSSGSSSAMVVQNEGIGASVGDDTSR